MSTENLKKRLEDFKMWGMTPHDEYLTDKEEEEFRGVENDKWEKMKLMK